jgi:hypothetical protein
VSGTFSSVWSISWVVVAAAGGVAFAVAASGLARHLLAPGEEVPLPPPASAEALALLPRDAAGPLRLFRQTIVVRAAVGVPLAVVAAVSMAQGAAELGGLALVVACITSLIVAGMQVTSLSGQRRFPEAFCNRDALSFAIVIACLAPVLDIVGGIATGQLMSLVSAAKHASSFWGMPSFRDIENLQAVASWTGRISMGLGLAGSYAVVSSLAATARGLANQELEDRARLARSLLLWGASVGIIAVILINNIRLRGDESIIILLLIAATLLSLGIALLVVLLRLASGLADAIEWRPPPGAAPEIGPPPTAAVS